MTACSFNETGEWIALGCARLGQLIVWEWQSEAYVYKQQGHYFDVNQCAYAPDGRALLTYTRASAWSVKVTTGSV